MDANTSANSPNEQSGMKSKILKRIIQVVFQFLVIMAILLISAGRLSWLWAWVYFGMGVGILAINTLILSPELIAERGQPRENVKNWDRVLTVLIIFPTLGMPIVIGLDERFGWSPDLDSAIHIAGLAFTTLGQLLFSWAMVSNKFFSTAVRIQMDRDHAVATAGPYRYVRHPGYVGMVISLLATPLLLGSLWALIPAGLTACLYILRTALEDRTLQDELDGYKDYARRVCYRLLPGIW
jgi:protein-S-isoprenylcysteine O-methyltransferase Ste14